MEPIQLSNIFNTHFPKKVTSLMSFARLFLILVLWIGSTVSLFSQSPKVLIAPPGGWVESVTMDTTATPVAGQESSYYYLLIDDQENITKQEAFTHIAYRILTSDGLQEMSDLNIEFDPSYQQLVFHSVSILRGGTRINRLPKQIQTIQREQSMDRHLYDGSVTAVINMSDVRVGDIVEYSFSRRGYNPIYEGNISRRLSFNYSIAYEKSFQRIIAPSSLDLQFKYVNTEVKPEIVTNNNQVIYTWVTNRVNGLNSDKQEPNWYDPYSFILITSFKHWAEVADWSAKLYQVSDQDMQTVLKDIYPKFISSSPEEYALKVIRFVQDEIRYLGFESGLNSHKPHSPAQVYQQRFGDCKDKSLLLSTLLKARGIESHPVLVNTSYREKLTDRLPSTNAFDHCVVQVKLNDRLFYIDPTINNQGGSIGNYYFPPYGKGLVVNASTTDLVDLPSPVSSSIAEVQTFDIASIGGEAILTVKTTYTGFEAESQRSYFSQNNVESIQKSYLTFYANIYPDIQIIETLNTRDRRDSNVFIVNEKYRIPKFWKPYTDQGKKIYCEFYPQTLEGYFNISKSTQRTAPYKLQYPLDFLHEISVNLPEAWNVKPDQQSIETDHYQYDFKVHYGDNHISLLTHYKTKQASIPTTHFPKFVEDHEKMMANLSYSLSYDPDLEQPTDNKWPGILLSIVSLIAGAWFVFWLYRHYDPQPEYPASWGKPIGGWLILVGIGVSVTPFRLLYDLITADYLLDGTAWLSMWRNGNYTYFVILVIEHIYNILYFLFATLVLILFFQRRSSVPRLISIMFAVSGFFTIADSLLAVQLDPESTLDRTEIVRAIVAAAIWIPYFYKSQRVKRTFVNSLHEDSNGGDLVQQPVTTES